MLSDRNFEILGKLQAVADKYEKSMTDLAIGWLAAQPHVSSVIAGATKPEQVEANVKAGEQRLSAETIAEIDAATKKADS
jgi:aryl-alcohol dehydrogenase-like predicted oxidoreductase